MVPPSESTRRESNLGQVSVVNGLDHTPTISRQDFKILFLLLMANFNFQNCLLPSKMKHCTGVVVAVQLYAPAEEAPLAGEDGGEEGEEGGAGEEGDEGAEQAQ